MTDEEITAALAICEAAVDGPWKVRQSERGVNSCPTVVAYDGALVAACDTMLFSHPNAAFIAAAREGYPAALAELQRLRTNIARANASLAQGMQLQDALTRAKLGALAESTKLLAQLAAVTAARDEACDLAQGQYEDRYTREELTEPGVANGPTPRRIAALRDVGKETVAPDPDCTCGHHLGIHQIIETPTGDRPGGRCGAQASGSGKYCACVAFVDGGAT